ncbi:MAG: hypothetical protein IH948_09255 [Bacteroidetes bacterium]|nr:hypothetical protein [Bacteroidota bacterium]
MIIKYGMLYWFPLDCPDIDSMFLTRLLRKFSVHYIPFSLRFYDKLFLREDQSKHARKLVEFCKKHGVETYVVQEGVGKESGNPNGHLPLKADYFLCFKKDVQWWIAHGMPNGRIRTYYPQKQAHQYSGIVFLHPFYLAENILHPCYWNGKNNIVMSAISKFMKEDVVFKLHNKNKHIVSKFIPKNRIVEGDAKELIKKYDEIYCFSDSSILFDCKMLDVEYILIDKKNNGTLDNISNVQCPEDMEKLRNELCPQPFD